MKKTVSFMERQTFLIKTTLKWYDKCHPSACFKYSGCNEKVHTVCKIQQNIFILK
uniref:Uncharacterized protein n=1 Tax=Rhizophora mucronata TaxID=61149 RepID=A0A2P2PZK8_RHIMU